MGQELGIAVGIRNEPKERRLSARGQSEQLGLELLWDGGRLVFPCRPWEGTNESLEEGQVSQCRAHPSVFESVLYLLTIQKTCTPARI